MTSLKKISTTPRGQSSFALQAHYLPKLGWAMYLLLMPQNRPSQTGLLFHLSQDIHN